jgi:predicted SnoaL-like aldol condensation-catalyzing enzyme
MSSNSEKVLAAMSGLFVNRDASVIDKYWGEPYLQHNPDIPDGRGDLAGIVAGLPDDFKYEPGMVVGEGDLVMLHGRYTGWAPKVKVAVDIFRLEDGKIVEHWDVLQDERPTASGRPMFTKA